MSGVNVIRYLLAHDSAIAALVPDEWIIAGDLPLKAVLPAIRIATVSAFRRQTVSLKQSKIFVSERVQVSVLTHDYASKKSLLAIIGGVLPMPRNTVDGVTVDCVIPDIEGPDLDDVEAQIYEQSRDFFVHWIE